ncbi:DUF305 domain-containing protein [Flavobacterium sp. MAH-1]|uniref:DUF305 domain-containing protein n=1 Tax=Flavobacterium agri TaxID=2743471 RepID=A0A7Y8Y183_9FLAO|nr:DUF305 domain-containing protein [Flavobacterium agri]NUY80497.1 DUF305 domain-containing protein [Flavobacterium agri]NYA70522.1 DUF305 domain-containing protein [Flavobacterium agri]
MENTTATPPKNGHYGKMGLMLFVSFLIMYAVMFLNVDSAGHIYLSLTRTYMSLLMVSPMALLMLWLMPRMYPHRKKNAAIATMALVVFCLSLLALRSQSFISDSQYMKAMIPHHSSAILTSKQANIKDPRVRALSEKIIRSQEEEIAQMKRLLDSIAY